MISTSHGPSSVPSTVSVVVPAKNLGSAKSRLGLSVGARAEVGISLLRTTLGALRGSAYVDLIAVVTSDSRVGGCASEFDAHAVQEEWPWRMNAAASLGRRYALGRSPVRSVAVVVADLPLLRAADVDAVIAEYVAGDGALMVPDKDGTGTTMLVQAASQMLPFRFGVSSAHEHERVGYRRFEGAPAGARFDLDTQEDVAALARARVGGVGRLPT